MACCYEVRIQGSGFRGESEGGTTLRGFYATRRVRAGEPFEANANAVAAIQAELAAHPSFQKSESKPAGSALIVEECYPVGWLMRLLTRALHGHVFIEDASTLE